MKSQSEIVIRNWTREDFPIVKNILLTTWKNTYTFIPEEDILTHFEKFYSADRLIEIFNDPFSKGIIAENHYDGGRNFIAMLKGIYFLFLIQSHKFVITVAIMVIISNILCFMCCVTQ